MKPSHFPHYEERVESRNLIHQPLQAFTLLQQLLPVQVEAIAYHLRADDADLKIGLFAAGAEKGYPVVIKLPIDSNDLHRVINYEILSATAQSLTCPRELSSKEATDYFWTISSRNQLRSLVD